MSSQPLCFLNGVAHSSQYIHNRAQAYGDGVFETIRIISGHAPLLALHLARLKQGLDCLGIEHHAATWQYINDFMHRLSNTTMQTDNTPYANASTSANTSINANASVKTPSNATATAQAASGKVKIIAYRQAGGQGYAPLPNASANILIYFEPVSLSGWLQMPKQLLDASTPLSSNPALAKIKHLNRLDYVLAAHRTPTQPNQALLLYNAQHTVIESLHHNIFMLNGDTVTTPVLTDAGVEGVFKQFLLGSVFGDLALQTQEKNMTESDVINADAVFLTNALTGVTPVLSYKNRRFSNNDFYENLHKKIQKKILTQIKNKF